MDKMDDIVDIAITEDSVIVYNSKYWRAFDMNGQVSIPFLFLCLFARTLPERGSGCPYWDFASCPGLDGNTLYQEFKIFKHFLLP